MQIRRKSITFLIAILFVLATVSFACAPEEVEEPVDPDDPGEPEEVQRLIIARDADAGGLDPRDHTSSPEMMVYAHNIIETLLNHDPETLELEPMLARDWEIVDLERGMVRLYLEEGIEFHDGEPFNAEAVVYNVERMIDPDKPGVMGYQYLAGAEVVDEYTVDVQLDMVAHPGALRYLAQPHVTGMISPAAAEELGEGFSRNPVGTGPFTLAEWHTEDRIILETFDGYWGDKPRLDEVVFRVIPEESGRMMALETGEVDMVVFPAPGDVQRLDEDENFVVHQTPAQRVVYVGCHNERPPLDDPLFRRALNWGTDREAIAEHVLEGLGFAETGYVGRNVFGYKDLSDQVGYDPDRAEEALDELGWVVGDDGIREKDGEKLELHLFHPSGRYLKDAEVAEAWQGQMRALGIDVTLETAEWGTFIDRIRQPVLDTDLFMIGWGAATGDADHFLPPNLHSERIPPEGGNRSRFSNPRADELIEAARQTADNEERAEMYDELMDILAEESPFVNIYGLYWTIITADHVNDYTIHGIDSHLSYSLNEVWIGD